MNFALEFIAALICVFACSAMICVFLHSDMLELETKQAQNQEFSDVCNILYITNFGINFDKEVEYKNEWCLSPKTETSNYIYIKRWYELFS